jgi:hypothetical protein
MVVAQQLPLLQIPGVTDHQSGWIWSVSSHHEFRTCQRKYFFSRIAARHNATDELRRAVYNRKRLQTVPLWRGSLLHQILDGNAVPIARNDPGALETALQLVTERVEAQFEFSLQRRYRSEIKSAAGIEYAALKAHEDGEPLPGEPEATKNALCDALRNLATLEPLKQYLRSGFVRTEFQLRASEGSVSVVGRADAFAARSDVTIIDWKLNPTGSLKARRQLEVYGWIAAHTERRAITLVEANLARGEIQVWPLTQERLEAAGDLVLESIDQIGALFGDHRYDEGILFDLDYAKSPGSCALCPYRALCGRGRP